MMTARYRLGIREEHATAEALRTRTYIGVSKEYMPIIPPSGPAHLESCPVRQRHSSEIRSARQQAQAKDGHRHRPRACGDRLTLQMHHTAQHDERVGVREGPRRPTKKSALRISIFGPLHKAACPYKRKTQKQRRRHGSVGKSFNRLWNSGREREALTRFSTPRICFPCSQGDVMRTLLSPSPVNLPETQRFLVNKIVLVPLRQESTFLNSSRSPLFGI